VTDFTREIGELGPSPLRKLSLKKKPERMKEQLASQP
jgi:hypothetical protein